MTPIQTGIGLAAAAFAITSGGLYSLWRRARAERIERAAVLHRWDLLQQFTNRRYSLQWYKERRPINPPAGSESFLDRVIPGFWVVFDENGRQIALSRDAFQAVKRALDPTATNKEEKTEAAAR